jgi:hypothetical protein
MVTAPMLDKACSALLLAGFLAGCGPATPTPVDGGPGDAGARADSGTAIDGGPVTDAGSISDAGVIDDGGFSRDAGPTSDAGPVTCAQFGFDCGLLSDGVGGTLDCGTCVGANMVCGVLGVPNRCGVPSSHAQSCAQQGFNCGGASDTMGGVLDCGACQSPQTCGGGGQPNVCG